MGYSPETLDFLPRGRVFLQHLLDWWGYVNAVLQRLADSLNTATLLNAALGDSLDEPLLTIHRVLGAGSAAGASLLAVAVAYVAVACRCSTAVAPFVAVACATGRAGCSGMRVEPTPRCSFYNNRAGCRTERCRKLRYSAGAAAAKVGTDGRTDGRTSLFYI